MTRKIAAAEWVFALLPLALLIVGGLLLALVASEAPEPAQAPTTGGAASGVTGGNAEAAARAPSALPSSGVGGVADGPGLAPNPVAEPLLAAALAEEGIAPARVEGIRGLTQEPDRSQRVQRIAFGSCFRQDLPAPIFRTIAAAEPNVLLLLGDNVYGSRSRTIGELVASYEQARDNPDFAPLRSIPALATWDDHDFGFNDAGSNHRLRFASAELLRTAWSADDAVGSGLPDGGVYRSVELGGGDDLVRVILLDTRTFRGPLTRKPEGSEIFGKYVPTTTADQQMLGDAQWQWLAAELEKPAALRILVSSIQVLAEGHGWERWGNLPAEQARLLAMLDRTGTDNLLILSGDRHNGATYVREADVSVGAGRIVEVTSSSFNRPFPNEDRPGPYRVGTPLGAENFGMIEIDWAARTASVGLRDGDGQPVEPRMTIPLR